MSRVHAEPEDATWFARHAPHRPRWVHKVWAWFGGYFWMACPLCGHHFGGHEWGGEIYDPDESTTGKGICLDCARFVRDTR